MKAITLVEIIERKVIEEDLDLYKNLLDTINFLFHLRMLKGELKVRLKPLSPR